MISSEITRSDPAANPAATESSGAPELGRQDFLALLIAQLENQDPLNPQDATEFTAQLATFSSLEQQIAMRESIDQLAELQTTAQTLGSVGLIGREVLAEGDGFSIQGGDAERPSLIVELPAPTEVQSIQVFDENGAEVSLFQDVGVLQPGQNAISWDRFDPPVADPGRYRFRVNLLSGDVTPTLLVRDRVTGAALQDGLLYLGDASTRLSAVREVTD